MSITEARTSSGRILKVRTSHDFPPIPERDMDWSAVDDATYDCDFDQDGFYSTHPVGHGRTEQAAIAALIERIEEIEPGVEAQEMRL